MKPCRRTRYIPVVTLIASITASACDTRELVAPAARGIAPRDRADAAQALGTTLLAPPPNSAPGVATSNPYEQFATVPESSWVVVNVSGQVKLTWNAEPCARREAEAPFWPCQTGSPTGTFAPSSPWEGGPVSLRGSWSDGGIQLIGLRGSGGSGESGGSAVGLYYNSNNAPMTLSGRVAANAVWAWDPNSGNGPFSWYMGGGYTVTATAVPSPFQVTESEPDADGYVTYTAEALYGLQFLNPLDFYWNPPAGAARWFFSFADPDSDRPDRSGWGWEVNECTNQLVCRFKPPTDVLGRMQATAYVETRAARARSNRADACSGNGSAARFACAPAEEFSLVCRAIGSTTGTDSAVVVTRGQSIACETQPQTTAVTITGWQFEGGQKPNGDPVKIVRSGPDRTWTGVMVQSGTISVTAKVRGDSVTRAVVVSVTPRVWAEAPPPEVTYDIIDSAERCPTPTSDFDIEHDCWTPYPPTRLGFLARTHLQSGLKERLGSRAARVTAGPNDGFAYVGGTTSSLIYQHLHIHLNRVFFAPHDPFWAHAVQCTPEVVLAWAKAHERKHAQLLLEGVAEGVANNLVEPQVYYESLAEMQAWLNGPVTTDIGEWLANMGDNEHVVHASEFWGIDPCRIKEELFPTAATSTPKG